MTVVRQSVHFDDLDPLGMVHNSRYAVFVERAMAAWWSARGHSFTDGRPTSDDSVHAVAEYAISYKAPVRGTGEIGVQLWIEHLGQTSATYGFRILSADEQTVHAEGRRVNVKLDLRTGRPAPWTATAREQAGELMATMPVEELAQQR